MIRMQPITCSSAGRQGLKASICQSVAKRPFVASTASRLPCQMSYTTTPASSHSSFAEGHLGCRTLQTATMGHSAGPSSPASTSPHCAASETDTVSPRQWRCRWRYMRSEKARLSQGLPKADWSRYHLQVAPSPFLSVTPCPFQDELH